jgi:hypothetical protein
MKDTKYEKIVGDAKEYVDGELEITEEEKEQLDEGNTWLARLQGNKAPQGSWRPNVVTRPANIQVSRRQLRAIGVSHGK